MATARRPVGRSAPVKKSSGYHGAVARAKAQEEEERAAARREMSQQSAGMPFRFFCPVGETRRFIIVDDAPDFFRFEHALKNQATKRWDLFTPCIDEEANCPVCKEAERPAYFAMYLTVIDLEPYINRDGEEVPWSKKLLVVKPAQHKKINRLYEREGTLRGMLVEVTRDSDKDASIGNDIQFVEFVPEEELAEYETVYIDSKNKEHEVIGHEVFDYDELFPAMTEQQLRALVGGRAEPGSREDDERSTGRGAPRGRDWQDDDRGATRGRARPAARGRGAAEEPDDDGADDDAPPARGARRPAPSRSAPSRAATPARRRPVDDDADADAAPEDDAEQDTPPRTARRGAPAPRSAPARAAAPARRSRSEDTDDDPPQRGGASLADRRRQLRSSR